MRTRERISDPGRSALMAAILLALAALLLAGAQTGTGQARPPAPPSPEHKCPVCGMFVAGFPDFLAAVVFRDGATAFFDGTKDMFRFLFDVGTYAPGRERADVAAVWVTDYYSLKWTDGAAAFYVTGSDVMGPMGRELVPFGKEGEAKVFLKDHKGVTILPYAAVTPAILKDID